jgi:hypothetical protein
LPYLLAVMIMWSMHLRGVLQAAYMAGSVILTAAVHISSESGCHHHVTCCSELAISTGTCS